MSRVQAHRLIVSAEVLEALPMGNKSAITSERQARELVAVPATERAAVVEKAIQATGSKITAAAIREAAKPEPVAPVAEPVEVTIEPPNGRTKPAAPAPLYTSYGLMYADLAITQLEKIAIDDAQRAAAFACPDFYPVAGVSASSETKMNTITLSATERSVLSELLADMLLSVAGGDNRTTAVETWRRESPAFVDSVRSCSAIAAARPLPRNLTHALKHKAPLTRRGFFVPEIS